MLVAEHEMFLHKWVGCKSLETKVVERHTRMLILWHLDMVYGVLTDRKSYPASTAA